jgi:hypothetical protein
MSAKFFVTPSRAALVAGPDSVVLLRPSERMPDASNDSPSMRPDVLVRGRGAARMRFGAAAGDEG